MIYNSDTPISTQAADVLGRASYACNLAQTITKYGIVDSLCIGLCCDFSEEFALHILILLLPVYQLHWF